MLEALLIKFIVAGLQQLYSATVPDKLVQVQKTRPEFEGDRTVVVFPFLRYSKKNPEQTASELGQYLVDSLDQVSSFNVIKGFLNLIISNEFWFDFYAQNCNNQQFGKILSNKKEPVVIEFSSPNTNKPLHLGHIRNNLLGWSVSEIMEAAGYTVARVNLVNDRGIHICKSMLAWQKWGNGITPEKAREKGDKLVGDYYIKFDKEYKIEVNNLINNGLEKKQAEQEAPLLKEAKLLLKKWENGDEKVRDLWRSMNGWVYEGFDKTYHQLGIEFDKLYYESETYMLGKQLVEEGLEMGILFKKNDGSVWCDLTDEGLDEKLLLRADGTSVYMTQDLGTAQLRYDDFKPSELIYVVGNEQNYHFEVLKLILKKLGRSWAEHIHHLSYGMVELPFGKMKSREGTVVDADDLMDEMEATAKKMSEELGKFDDFNDEESKVLYNMIGLGALKYFILKVDPKKTILFNPEESIDFNGHTGPFIQYTHARIRSVLRKAVEKNIDFTSKNQIPEKLESKEKNLLKILYEYSQIIQQAAENLSPALVANYVFELAKEYNQFYHEYQILKETDKSIRDFRLGLSEFVGNTIKSAMALLGIEVPERM